MSAVLHPRWTIERFLDWAGTQEGKFEFDGLSPVAMVGGTATHSRVTWNIHAALRTRLRGGACSSFGPDLGLQVGDGVRYPDVLITCTKFPGRERLAPDVRVVFEVLSPTTERTDRITKVADYARVPTLLRYILVETRFPALTVLHRSAGSSPWTAHPLGHDGMLDIPEIGISIPVAEIYEDVDVEPEGLA